MVKQHFLRFYNVGYKKIFELFEDDTYSNHCFFITMTTHVGMNAGQMSFMEPYENFCCPNLKIFMWLEQNFFME